MKLRKILFVAALPVILLQGCTGSKEIRPTKNLIVMITDGTSTSLLSVARWYKRHIADSMELALNMDPYLCALVSTNESDAPVTDSAPAMSAYMTGVRSRAGNLSIYPEPTLQDLYPQDSSMAWRPAATVMEAAMLLQGKAAGLVATVPFCHATPAATCAHAGTRSFPRLALQMASYAPEVVFAGGTAVLTGEARALLDASGTTVLTDDAEGFRNFEGDRLWALWNDELMDFEIDRDDADEPSIAEMTAKAISILSKNKKGFFLMVEGSKVDFGAHSNDVMETVGDFLAFDEAVGVALDFARRDGNTTVVILPDHGNSGITMPDKNLKKYTRASLEKILEGMSDIRTSSYKLSQILQQTAPEGIKDAFREHTGIDLTAEELALIHKYSGVTEGDYTKIAENWNLQKVIVDICNSRMHIGFTSGNHTAEDVFLAVYNPRGQRPQGVISNVELNGYLRGVLGLKKPLRALTEQIFAPYDEVFPADSCSIDPDRSKPVLTVRDGGRTLRFPGWKNIVYIQRGSSTDSVYTRSPAVYMRQNQMFYIDRTLAETL